MAIPSAEESHDDVRRKQNLLTTTKFSFESCRFRPQTGRFSSLPRSFLRTEGELPAFNSSRVPPALPVLLNRSKM